VTCCQPISCPTVPRQFAVACSCRRHPAGHVRWRVHWPDPQRPRAGHDTPEANLVTREITLAPDFSLQVRSRGPAAVAWPCRLDLPASAVFRTGLAAALPGGAVLVVGAGEKDHHADDENPGGEEELGPLVGAGRHQQNQAHQVSEVADPAGNGGVRRPAVLMHNAIVNPTGLGPTVLGIPQPDLLLIMSGLVILAGAIIAIATRGRLGLQRPESDADLE
jgi:hypothetical protein